MQVAIFGSRFESDKLNQVMNVFSALRKVDAEIQICKDFYQFLTTVMNNPPAIDKIITCEDFSADYAISIGGDGTYLRTAHRVGRKGIPIVGINTGRLGFLADIESVEIEEVIYELYKHYYSVTELSLLRLKVDGNDFSEIPAALNEIAIMKKDSSSMINIHVTVDGEFLNGYQADGLVVSTPTGSTAYNLSLGGPIIMPESKSIIISAIAPHNLTVRPIVLSDRSVIDIEVESRSHNFLVSLDGYSYPLSCISKLQISLSDFIIKSIRRYNHTFTQTIRKKLMWGIDPRIDYR